DFAEVYQQVDQAGRDNIGRSQAELREWDRRFSGNWEYLRWPVCFTAANARFTQLWQDKFAPLRKWICDAATCVAAELQRDYLDFRLDHGLVTYGDQIALAEELLQHPVAAQRIREETFRDILNNKDGQVRFVELQPRPKILPGKVIRLPLVAKELLPAGKKLKDYQKARIEAEYLARWIKKAELKKLSADSWREVAILCPRKAWLQTMDAALRRVGLPVAIQSESDVKGDSPAYAWLTALLTIMT